MAELEILHAPVLGVRIERVGAAEGVSGLVTVWGCSMVSVEIAQVGLEVVCKRS